MRFKGYNFRQAKKIVMLRGYFDTTTGAVTVTPTNGAYVRFGRICKPEAKGAEETQYTYPDGSRVWARAVPVSGYSRTNMAYGEDGKVYLALDGRCFTAKQDVIDGAATL